MPKYLPVGLTQYVLNTFFKKPSRYHVTQDDVSAPLQRLEAEKMTGHQSVRGRSGAIALIYKTHWVGLCEPSWEQETDLQLSRTHILRCRAGTPDQHRQTNRFYRRMRVGTAQRELSRNNGERFLAPGYACGPRGECLRPYRDTVPPKGIGKISASTAEDGVYLFQFLDDPGPIKLPLPPARYTTSTGAVRGSCCLQVNAASNVT